MRREFLSSCGVKGNKDIRSCIEKNGLFCNECSIKSGRIKQIESCLQKYGVECSLQSQLVKNKIKATNLERYGVEDPQQSQIVRDKGKETCLENMVWKILSNQKL